MAKGKLQKAEDRARLARAAAANLAIATSLTGAVLAAGADAVILAKLPTGYRSEAEGLGKPAYTNKRIQLLTGTTVALAIWGGKGLWARVGLVTSATLLGAAIRNHIKQYNGIDIQNVELYQ